MTDQLNNTPKPPRRRKSAAEGESIPEQSTTGRKTTPTAATSPNPFNPNPSNPSKAAASKVPSKATVAKEKPAASPKLKAKPTSVPPSKPSPSLVQTFLRTISRLLGRMFLWVVRAFWRLNWRFKLVSMILLAALLGISYVGLQQVTTQPVIAAFFPPSVRYWSASIARWSQEYDVDPNLIATLMQIESCGWTSAESYAAAQGLFQVMPMHFSEEEKVSMTDPEVNAKRGMGVIKDCLERSDGDVGLAMACYNGGPRLIFLDQTAWPEQSQRYFYWGTGIYGDAHAGRNQSPRLQEWLSAGGQSLCQRAEAALNLPISTDIPYIPVSLPTDPPTADLPTLPPPTLQANTIPIATLPPDSDLPTFDATRR